LKGFENELFSKNTGWMKDFYLITIEIHDWMLPHKSPSQNFFREHSKEIRKTNNLTQRQLAIKLSVYQSYVSKVELGQKNLNIIELKDYLKGYNYYLVEFLNTLDKNVT
jgi:hypothetical protein